MAQEFGIASISGVAIANVGKRSAVTKSNIWSTSGQQRQASLFKSLSNQNWTSYTQGKNSASFSVASANGAVCAVYFSVANHTQGTTYNLNFTKTATISGKSWGIVASVNTNFGGAGTQGVAMPTAAGVANVNLGTNLVPSGTIYIGIIFNAPSGSDTLQVTDLIVT